MRFIAIILEGYYMDFINKLTEILKEKNITQYKLCKDLEIGQSTFSSWKKGKSPSVEKIIAIVRYLEISADWLLEIDSKKNNLTKNEQELLDNFKILPEREQIKLIGIVEEKAKPYQETQGKSSESQTG